MLGNPLVCKDFAARVAETCVPVGKALAIASFIPVQFGAELVEFVCCSVSQCLGIDLFETKNIPVCLFGTVCVFLISSE